MLINQSIHTLDLVQWFGGKGRVRQGRGVHRLAAAGGGHRGGGQRPRPDPALKTACRPSSTPQRPPGQRAGSDRGGVRARRPAHPGRRALYEVSRQGLTEITPPSENKLGEKGLGQRPRGADRRLLCLPGRGAAPKITGHEAIEAVKLLRGIYASSQSGQRVFWNLCGRSAFPPKARGRISGE